MGKMKGKVLICFYLAMSLVLVACLPSGKRTATCATGEVFDTAAKTCVSTGTQANSNNQNPVFIATIANVTVLENSASTITTGGFTVDEGGGPSENSDTITFTFSSDNTSLVDSTSITVINFPEVFGTDAQSLTPSLRIIPVAEANGSANISITLNDGQGGTATSSFTLSITAEEDPPTADSSTTSLTSTTTNEDDVITVSFTANEGGGSDEDSQSIIISTISSSNTAIINPASANTTISYNGASLGTGAAFPITLTDGTADAATTPVTLLITPESNQSGVATLSMLLTDSNNRSSAITFQSTVQAVNDAPTYTTAIASPAAQNEDVGTFSVAFKIDEGGASDEDSQVVSVLGVTSSNTTLLPTSNIAFLNNGDGGGVLLAATASYPFSLGDNGASALTADISDDDVQIQFTPATNENGTALITITYTDSGSPTATFDTSTVSIVTLSINSVNDNPVFTNANATQTINEGSGTTTLTFNIDEGGSTDEDSQTITLSASSGNTLLVTDANIVAASFVETGDSNTNLATFTVTLNDSDVNTGTGVMTAAITATDGVGGSTTETFTIDIDPVDDQERFISATPDIITTPSITFNVGEIDRVITLTIGEGGNGGTTDTNFEIDPDQLSLTVTSSNQSLIRGELITASYASVNLGNVSNPLTNIEGAGVAGRTNPLALTFAFVPGQSGTTTIGMTLDDNQATGGAAVTQTFVVQVDDVVAVHGGWHNVKALGKRFFKDGTTADPQVTLEWRDFQVFIGSTPQTSGSYSWEIYRAEPITGTPNTAPTMNYDSPLGTAAATTVQSGRSFTDSTVETGKIYYYEVRPVLTSGTPNSIEIPTSDTNFNKIRVVIPPDNMALVHRWVANTDFCEITGQTIDKTNNFRCAYTGPSGVAGFFDMGKDYFVDIGEAGCNFTDAPTCAAQGCIDIVSNPNTTVAASGSVGNVYYDRLENKCFIGAGASWTMITSATVAGYTVDASVLGLPPLTNVDQAGASNYCQSRSTPQCDNANCANADYLGLFPNGGRKELVSRKVHVQAATWDKANTTYDTAAEINTIESGVDHPTSQHCNTNRAAGATFFDVAVPGPSFIDGLPNSNSSTERKFRSGSSATALCTSKHGIQDLVGNMREWNADRCTTIGAANVCDGITAALNTEAFEIVAASFSFSQHAANTATVGIGGTSACLGNCDTQITFASIPGTGINYSLYPGLGLITASGANMAVEVVTTSFPPDNFHNDIYDLNNTSEGDTIRAFTSGGHSDFSDAAATGTNGQDLGQGSAAAAGQWTFELIDSSRADLDTGFRCMIPVNY